MLICDHLVSLLTLRKLYESPGGNQVDGLPPASSIMDFPGDSRETRLPVGLVADNAEMLGADR